MGGWNKRKGELFIPNKDTHKTYECEVCGAKIVPRKERKYIVKETLTNGGLVNAIQGTCIKPKLFDAFDCEICGCQFVAKERLKKVD